MASIKIAVTHLIEGDVILYGQLKKKRVVKYVRNYRHPITSKVRVTKVAWSDDTLTHFHPRAKLDVQTVS